MEFIIITLIILISLIWLKIIYKINIKRLKQMGEENQELDKMVEKYPSNIEICKKILKKLNNESVKIEEDNQSDTCLYIVVSNKIKIANLRNSFTRIQTIAHECLHSIQDKRILLFNFIYSSIYIMFFYFIVVLGILGKIQNEMLFLSIYILLCFIYYFVRSYLENDAMIKAKFLSKEYMKDENISNNEEIEKIVNGYDKVTNLGVKVVNYNLFFTISIKIIILSLIFYFR